MVVEIPAPRANVPRILSAFVLFLLSSLLPAQELRLPLQEGSLRFAVIGDAGTGKRAQYEVAEQLALFHRKSSFELVLMLGDNLYGREGPGDYKKKFELPYKPLLDADVKFYAALGNHDNPKQRFYSLFNMDRKRFYAFRPAPQVQLFALDSTRMNRRSAELVGRGAAQLRQSVENLLLPQPDLFIREKARLLNEAAPKTGTAFCKVWGQCRLCRTR